MSNLESSGRWHHREIVAAFLERAWLISQNQTKVGRANICYLPPHSTTQ